MTSTLDQSLESCMHDFEYKVPIHGCKVDILKLNGWTWRTIGPADMSTDKTLHLIRSRKLFNKRCFTPDVDDPLCNTLRCFIHALLYCASDPPSTLMACPVTNEAASEHNQTTASATSSGLPSLPLGLRVIAPSSNCGFASIPCCAIGVRMTPGQTQFTRIPCLAYCNAADLVSPTTPCLLAS